MGRFLYHPNARDDIQALSALYPEAMLRLGALLRQLEADPAMFQHIWQDGYGRFSADAMNVLEWRSAQKHGYDLWRLKDLGLERDGVYFRIFYCQHAGRPNLAHVLAVIRKYEGSREFDYDDLTHPDVRRVLRAYLDVRHNEQS